MAVLSPVPFQKFFSNNGKPLVGGKLFTYSANTSTKVDTYSNASGTLNTNPIVLDYRGECNLWLLPNVSYKLVLAPPDDTDPPTAPIKTINNVLNSQLLTLFGGVDVGSANNYIINYTASFTSYVDGTIIYFVPSHTNTTDSVLNVNGLGFVSILNQNGTQLYAGQIRQNEFAEVVYQSGKFILLSDTASAAFSAVRQFTTQGMPASTTTDCIFPDATINQGNAYDALTGIFTAPAYGVYSFSTSINLSPTGTNCVLSSIYFSKNNDTSGTSGLTFYIGIGTSGQLYSNTGNNSLFSGSAIVVMNVGDTMRLKWSAGTSGAGQSALGLASAFSGSKVA